MQKNRFNDKILGVIGGFHLFEDDKNAVDGTINYFKKEKPEFLYPMHCIDFNTLSKIHSELGIIKYSSGDVIDIKL